MILILYLSDTNKEYKHRRLSKCTMYQQVYEFIGKSRMLVGISM